MIFSQAPALYSYAASIPSDILGIQALGATSTKFMSIVNYGIKSSGTTTDPYTVATSLDGVTWTRSGYKFNTAYIIGSLAYASNIDTMFAVDQHGSVFKSTDAGVTWTLLSGSTALAALYTTSATNNPNGGEGIGSGSAIVSADGNVIMLPGVSISYTVYGSSSRGSLYKSTDGGATWTNLVYAAAYLNGTPSKIATNNAGMWVTVGTYGGTFMNATWNYITYSTNNGATWTPVSNQTAPSTDNTAGYNDVKYANNLWMACGKGRIAYSTDGITWTNVTAGLPSTTSFLSIAYGNGKWVIISPNPSAAYTSTDNGLTWTIATAPWATNASYESVMAYTNSTFALSNTVTFSTMT